MNDLIINDDIKIESMIYVIRGKQVMLDRDLAQLYECSNGTKDINKAVKRNIEKFPEYFYFKLTNEEFLNLRFQNGTANNKVRFNPYVFTEQGVAMLASVLRTPVAARVSVDIMRAFVAINKIEDEIIINRFMDEVNRVVESDNEIRVGLDE